MRIKIAVFAISLSAAVGASASIITETVVVAQQMRTQNTTYDTTLHFIGNQFDPTLGTLNGVGLVLTADLNQSAAGAVRIAPGNDPWQINWTYSGNLTLLTLSSTWAGTGPTLVNPQPSFTGQSIPIGLGASSSGTTLATGLSPYIGNSTFDLSALLHTVNTWSSQPNNNSELGNFLPFAGGTLQVSYNFTPVPEPTTMIAGALLLLPFGASTLRMFRRNRTA